MTVKRFELNNIIKTGHMSFWDNTNQEIVNTSKALDLLNALYEENTEHKQELDNIYLLIGRGDWSGLIKLLTDDEKYKIREIKND